MPRHGNQTLVDIMQIKSEPIASDSPWLMFKLIDDQGCKHNDKKCGLFVRKLSFFRSKNGFLSFVVRELLTFEFVMSNRSPLGPLITKFCLVRIGLSDCCFKHFMCTLGRTQFVELLVPVLTFAVHQSQFSLNLSVFSTFWRLFSQSQNNIFYA